MAIVPCKPFDESKQRLTPVLDQAARAELSQRMLENTLAVLTGVDILNRVAVISRDQAVLRLARRFGAWSIWEGGTELNRALEQATRVAISNGIQAVLIIPADLPELSAAEVRELIERGSSAPSLVISPAQRDEGTNALLINPAGLIAYAFGEASYREHTRRAEAVGASVHVYRSAGLEFDLDLPQDWEALKRSRTWESYRIESV